MLFFAIYQQILADFLKSINTILLLHREKKFICWKFSGCIEEIMYRGIQQFTPAQRKMVNQPIQQTGFGAFFAPNYNQRVSFYTFKPFAYVFFNLIVNFFLFYICV